MIASIITETADNDKPFLKKRQRKLTAYDHAAIGCKDVLN